VQSHARIVAKAERGRVGVPVLRSAPPLTLRRVGPCEIAIVSSAAWPVGGDAVILDITVGPGADLTVSSVAASLAYPSPCGSPSSFTMRVDVASGGAIHWRPEPLILLAGCDHRVDTSIRLGDRAVLTWRDEVCLGRHDEPTGSLRQRIVIDSGGRPLVRNELGVGPAWPDTSTPEVLGGRCVALATAYDVGTAAGSPRAGTDGGAVWSENPLGPRATAWSVVAGPFAAGPFAAGQFAAGPFAAGPVAAMRSTLARRISEHRRAAHPSAAGPPSGRSALGWRT
jgi:urease accessory protein